MKLGEYLESRALISLLSPYSQVNVKSVTTQRIDTADQIIIFSLVEFTDGKEILTMRDENENMYLKSMEEISDEDKQEIINGIFK